MKTALMATRNTVAEAAAAGKRYPRKKRCCPSPKVCPTTPPFFMPLRPVFQCQWRPGQLLQTRIRSTALDPKRRRNRVCRVTSCGPPPGAPEYSTMPTMLRTLSNSMNPTRVIILTLTLKRKRMTRLKLSLDMRETRDTRMIMKTFGTKTS